MTYNVFSGTLNLTQSIKSRSSEGILISALLTKMTWFILLTCRLNVSIGLFKGSFVLVGENLAG